MRILVDTRDLLIARTGVRVYLEELIKQFANERKNHFIYASPKKISNSNSRLGKILGHINFYLWKQVILPYKAIVTKADAILCVDYVVPYFKFGYKTFVVFHGANFWKYPEYYNKYWVLLLNKISIPAAKRANAIITVSEFSKNDICIYTGIRPEHIHVVHIADRTDFNNDYDELELSKFGLSKGQFILHVGVKEKRKNLPRLVEAFAQVRNKLGGLKLVFVGQNAPMKIFDDTPKLIELTKRYNLEDSILQLGHVSSSQLELFYKSAKFYVFPSYYEGFGIPVVECFRSGLPLVASNVGAIPEIARDGAQYFDPYDIQDISEALIKVNKDNELRQHLIERGKELCKLYSWGTTSQKIVKIIEEE